jgi:uncharacterized protein (DUF2147 family)
MERLSKPPTSRHREARLGIVVGAAVLLAAAPVGPPTGLWLTENGEGVIWFQTCGTGLCGRIVGLKDYQANGRPPLDWQGRPLCGLELTELAPRGPNLWRGDIVDPRDGTRYDAEAWVDEQGRLRLRGFVVVPLFGSTQTWTRYEGSVTQDCHVLPKYHVVPRH